MAHDIVIRGGELVDGTGREPVRGGRVNVVDGEHSGERAGPVLRHQA